MDLTTLMRLLEEHYNTTGGTMKVLIGERDGKAREINQVHFDRDSGSLVIF